MGNEHPPTGHRVFWGLGEGAVAAILLMVGGLKALQTASIIAALPFSLVMILMMHGLVRSLKSEGVVPVVHRKIRHGEVDEVELSEHNTTAPART